MGCNTDLRIKLVFWLVLLAFASFPAYAQTAAVALPWPKVQPVDWSKIKPSDFSNDELDLPHYLARFHVVANSVVETGDERGFINIVVWRNPQDNRPYNARIMENILSLAFFYSTNRTWNQYYGSPAVRLRLEAALDYWCRIQSSDGRFSEYGPQRWNLAATAFATKFMGESLRLLRGGPPIDARLLQRVVAADRRAIRIVLTDKAFYEHGKNFTNQYTNVFAGALAYLKLYPDPEISSLLNLRVRENTRIFQSPVGFFYEARGPDWGYNLGTHHSNLWMAYHYARGTPLGKLFLEEERRFVDWLAYNVVREPDGSGFSLNRGVETRQRRPFIDTSAIVRSQDAQGHRLVAAEVALARPFLPTTNEVKNERARQRAELEKNWPPANNVPSGQFSSFSPYVFLHRSQGSWFPSIAQREQAINDLPSNWRPFVHQRMDPRERGVFTFVKQPGYYATFNSGPHITAQQRFGLGLLWHPEIGTVLQTQTGSANAAWGTVFGRNQEVFEADTLNAEFSVDGKNFIPLNGNHDLPRGTLTVRYKFTDLGEKRITFGSSAVSVEVHHSRPFREQIPLLVGGDDILKVEQGKATLSRAGKSIAIVFDPGSKAETIDSGASAGNRRVVTLNLSSNNDLTYRFEFGSDENQRAPTARVGSAKTRRASKNR